MTSKQNIDDDDDGGDVKGKGLPETQKTTPIVPKPSSKRKARQPPPPQQQQQHEQGKSADRKKNRLRNSDHEKEEKHQRRKDEKVQTQQRKEKSKATKKERSKHLDEKEIGPSSHHKNGVDEKDQGQQGQQYTEEGHKRDRKVRAAQKALKEKRRRAAATTDSPAAELAAAAVAESKKQQSLSARSMTDKTTEDSKQQERVSARSMTDKTAEDSKKQERVSSRSMADKTTEDSKKQERVSSRSMIDKAPAEESEKELGSSVRSISEETALAGEKEETKKPQRSSIRSMTEKTAITTDTRNTVDFRNDPIEEMTYGRRIALALMRYSWYNPLGASTSFEETRKEDHEEEDITTTSRSSFTRPMSFVQVDEKPDLARAWAYFDHVALDRYIVTDDDTGPPKGVFDYLRRFFSTKDHQLERADPGTKATKTRLYDPILTPHSQLGDFGLGIGLYFSTVRAVGLICFLAGLINISSMMYFRSDHYMTAESRSGIRSFLLGSAICNGTSWVPCPECDCTFVDTSGRRDIPRWADSDRCVIESSTETGGEPLTFALRNNCEAAVWEVASLNYLSILFFLVAIFFLGKYLREAEIAFDEDQQTAQDYSILITNPPENATNPDEWRRYFKNRCDGAQVTVCTVALDNDLLVQALVDRRQTYRKIRYGLPPGSSMDVIDIAHKAADIERKRSFWHKIMALIIPGVPEHFGHLVVINAKITALVQMDYVATQVFVSFDTEADQRHVLEKLTVGSARATRNDKSALSDTKYLFRDKYVLDVREAPEPNTIHWQSLNVTGLIKLKQQLLSTIFTFGGIIAVAYIVREINDINSEYTSIFSALAISGFNSAFPTVAKIIVSFESHEHEGSKQSSLYFKIAAFRWVITAVIITLITPFTSTLDSDGGLIPQVYAIFFSEILTINVIQVMDVPGHFKRHILAPRAQSQDAMNILFRGEEIELAERYTNVTKLIFLALWYSSIYPAAFFMASFALFVNYFTDRFGFLRTWKRAAHLGSEVSALSRKYFFSWAIIAMVFISSFYWSGFPFDNLCETEDYVYIGNSPYVGTFTITPESDPPVDVTISQGDSIFKYCNQDLLQSDFSFPFIPAQQEGRGGEWMTPTQEQITTVFGWSSIGIIVIVVLKMVGSLAKGYLQDYRGNYQPTGEDQNINFSEVPSISSYIPQVQNYLFSYPLIVCDSEKFDPDLFDWEDPEKPYEFYDLTKDADALMESKDYDKSQCFSKVKYWVRNREEAVDSSYRSYRGRAT